MAGWKIHCSHLHGGRVNANNYSVMPLSKRSACTTKPTLPRASADPFPQLFLKSVESAVLLKTYEPPIRLYVKRYAEPSKICDLVPSPDFQGKVRMGSMVNQRASLHQSTPIPTFPHKRGKEQTARAPVVTTSRKSWETGPAKNQGKGLHCKFLMVLRIFLHVKQWEAPTVRVK